MENQTTDQIAPEQGALNQTAEATAVEPSQQAPNQEPPSAIPYNRFQEVNAEKNQLKQELQFLQQQNQQIMGALNNLSKQSDDYDPEAELLELEQDPRAYFSKYRETIKQELLSEQQAKQDAYRQQESAFNGAVTRYPAVANSPEAQQLIVNQAQALAHQVVNSGQGGMYTWDHIYDMAAQQVASFVNRTTPTAPTTAVAMEGNSTFVPPKANSLDAQIEEARSNKDVVKMLALKAQKRRNENQ